MIGGAEGPPDGANPNAQAPGPDGLAARLERHWRLRGWTRAGDRVIVACSGGTDSLVLLHLLRFGTSGLGIQVEAAHFDHRMRPESEDEARWMRGVAGAWGVHLHEGCSPVPARGEAHARELRYAFLLRLRSESDPGEGREVRVVTAHQADDQLETILFRLLRGAGLEGLRGIPDQREPGILRPFLPFRRAEIEAYASWNRLNPRRDPTNRSARFARGRLRERVLPLLEQVHPGASSGLLRVARNAGRLGEALDALLAPVLAELQAGGDDPVEGSVTIDRGRFLSLEPAIQSEVLRKILRDRDRHPSESGTEAALQFMRTGSSGRAMRLAGGVEISRSFGTLRVGVVPGDGSAGPMRSPEAALPPSQAAVQAGLTIHGPEAGGDVLVLEGQVFRVFWGPEAGERGRHRVPDVAADGGRSEASVSASFLLSALAFPLLLRGPRPGDRIRTGVGRKKLKKLLCEFRIPAEDRPGRPVLVDSNGEVIWVPGILRASGRGPRDQTGADGWTVTMVPVN